MLNPVLFLDGCVVSVVKYLPARAHQLPRGGDADLCSLALPDLGVEMVESEDLNPLLAGRHLLLELERDHWKLAYLHMVVWGGDTSFYPRANPHK